ncbi:unnamed protein product, partial [Rotaria magnacalcarata]
TKDKRRHELHNIYLDDRSVMSYKDASFDDGDDIVAV